MPWILLACVSCALLSSIVCEDAVDYNKMKFFEVDDDAVPADGIHFRDLRTGFPPHNTSAFRTCEVNSTCGFYLIDPETSERALYIKACRCPEGYSCVEDRLKSSKYWIYICLKADETTEAAWDPYTETYYLRDSENMATVAPASTAAGRAARILPDPTTTAVSQQELPQGILDLLNATNEDEICTKNAFCGFDIQAHSGYSRVGFVKLCTCPEGFECQYHCYQFNRSAYHGYKCVPKGISSTDPERRSGFLHHLKTEL